MAKEYTYKAFISYRHISLDKRVAERLQKMLESYKIPKDMAKQKKWRIFRDETELPTSSNLSDDIKTALRNSEFLIVVCSKVTAKSRWCMEEITYFKELHNQTTNNIITLLIDGEPEESFPKELCTTMIENTDESGYVRRKKIIVEPLAANITSSTTRQTLKKLRSEFLRIVAPLIGCGYDDLYNRERRRKIKTLAIVIAAAFAGVTAFGVYNSAMLMKLNTVNIALADKNAELELKTKELDESNTELVQANTDLDNTNAELDKTNTELDESNSNLEQKNTELDKMNFQLNTTNKNLDKVNGDLQKSNINLEKKTNEAEDNLDEANKQRDLAEQNLEEAERQKNIAEQNLAYAEEQRQAAEENLAYAEEQKKVAEQNLALVNEKNKQLRINSANMAAKTAEADIQNNNRESAIKTILDNKPYENNPTELLPSGMNVLSQAVYAYQSTSAPQIDRYLETKSDIKYCEYSADYSKLLAYDSEGYLYVWDVNNGKLLLNNHLDDIIKCISFSSDNNIIIVTNKNISLIRDDYSIIWTRSSKDIFNENYSVATEKVTLSGDKQVMAVRTISNKFAFIEVLSGDILYIDSISEGYLSYCAGDFYGNSKYIVGYYTGEYDVSGNPAYNTKFIHFDIENKKWEYISYETDLYVCGLAYCAGNAFSIEGYKYDKNGKSNYWVNTIKTDGTEVYSKLLTDYNQWFEDINFRALVWEKEDLALLMLVSNTDLIFIDIKTGEIYDRKKFDKSIKRVYTTDTLGVLHILCENGIYEYYLPGTEAIKSISTDANKAVIGLFSFNDTNSEATQFFLWGNRDRYAVVGKDKSNIVLYKNQRDDNYKEIDIYFSEFKENQNNNYFTIKSYTDNKFKLYIYNSQTKTLMSEIADIYNNYYLYKNYVVNEEYKDGAKILTWYNVHTGKQVRTENLDSIYKLIATPDENSIIACASHKILKITDDIQEIFSDDNVSITSSPYYINNDAIVIETRRYDKNYNEHYELCKINMETGERTVLLDSEDKFFEYSEDKSTFGNNKFATCVKENIAIINTDTGMLEKEIPLRDISVKKMIFSPDNKYLIVYSNNNILYKYNITDGELLSQLSLPLTKDEVTSPYGFMMSIDKERDIVIVKRNAKVWLVDIDSFTPELEYNGYDFKGFLHSTQEVVMASGRTTRFYPYYTSEQLIDMAEKIVKE